MAAPRSRLPGERTFALALLAFAAFVLVRAHGIAGLSSLSSPGALPLAAGGAMAAAASSVLLWTWRLPPADGESVWRLLLPGPVLGFVLLVAALAVALEPLGFLVSAPLFLVLAMCWLYRRQPLRIVGWSLLAVLVIYALFRLVFEVLLPEGVVPERAILAWLSDRLDWW